MLGIGGRFVGARGMVPMPNLANLSPTAATAAIQAAGLRLGSASEVSSSNSGDNEKVFSQSVSAGTLVDYDSDVNYSYYRYVPPAIVYTLDTVKISDGPGIPEEACNVNGSNIYEHCTRTRSPFKYKLLANGVWDGVSYGGYGSDYTGWSCSVKADKCGNVRSEGTRRFVSAGTCQQNNTRVDTYSYDYVAGTPTGVLFQETVACTFVAAVPIYQLSKVYTQTACIDPSTEYPAGYKVYNDIWMYSDGVSRVRIEGVREPCPCPETRVRGEPYYFGCDGNSRQCTRIDKIYDCNGNFLREGRVSCDPIPCACSSTAGIIAGTCTTTGISTSRKWTGTRTCTYRNPDCSTESRSETVCGGCDPWVNTSPCIGRQRYQSQTCFNANCTTFTNVRTVSC